MSNTRILETAWANLLSHTHAESAGVVEEPQPVSQRPQLGPQAFAYGTFITRRKTFVRHCFVSTVTPAQAIVPQALLPTRIR